MMSAKFSIPSHIERDILAAPRDPYRRFLGLVPKFVILADKAEQTENGEYGNSVWSSYRYFPVIAVTVAGGHDRKKQGSILVAGNQKTRHKTKVCAESRLLGRAQKIGTTVVPGVFLRAIGDVDQIADVCGGRRRLTLPPCVDCSHRFDNDPKVVGETPIVTSAFGGTTYQVTTPRELNQFYRDLPVPRAFHQLMPDFQNWDKRVGLYDTWLQETNVAERTVALRSQLVRAALLTPQDGMQDVRHAGGWHDVLVV